MKIYFIETTDPYGSIGYAGGNGYTDETEAERIAQEKYGEMQNAYSYMVQELHVKYSHRNGETDSTEIDGWYFVEWNGYWTVRRYPSQNPDNDPLEKYYGPIPMPEIK